MIIKSISPGVAKSIKYVPDMTTYGNGKITLALNYTYSNAKTGETYSEKYNGFVYYNIPQDNVPIEFGLSTARK